MRTTAILILAALVVTPAAGADCRRGTNMPGGDANPVKPIASDQARMVCTDSVLITRTRDGSEQRMRTWSFDLKK